MPGVGSGLRCRISRVPGRTPKGVLARPVHFPALLENFTISEEFTHTDYLTPAGERSIPAPGGPKRRELRTSDLATLLIDYDTPWATGPFTSPRDVYREIIAAARSRQPVQLTVTMPAGSGRQAGAATTELDIAVTIRSIERAIRSGEPDARYWGVRVKEWRSVELGRLGKTASERSGRHNNIELPTTHKLKAADTLHSLADYYFNDATAWRDIAKANGLTSWPPSKKIVDSPRFKVGSSLKIPGDLIVARSENVIVDVRPGQVVQ